MSKAKKKSYQEMSDIDFLIDNLSSRPNIVEALKKVKKKMEDDNDKIIALQLTVTERDCIIMNMEEDKLLEEQEEYDLGIGKVWFYTDNLKIREELETFLDNLNL